MSIILDALHRSESERADQQGVPGIASDHSVAESRGRLGAGLLLSAFVIILLAIIAWLLLERATVTPAVSEASADGAIAKTEEPVSTPPAQVPVTPATRSTSLVPINTPLAASASQAAVADLYQQASPAQARGGAATANTSPPTAGGASREQAEAIDIEALTAVAQAELAAVKQTNADTSTTTAPESEVDFLADLPQSFKDQVPSLYYSQHSWARQSSQRFTVVNGERRVEGDQVAYGVRLLEILPESSVFDYQGTSFQLRALNSWVNL